MIVVAMARDNEDIYMKNVLDGFCMKLNAGAICEDAEEKLNNTAIIRDVNVYIDGLGGDTTACENENIITPPSIVCLNGDQSIDAEYPLLIGDPVEIDDILYGWYDLNPLTQPNPITPNAADVAADIAANPGNYTTDTWVPAGVSANIVNTYVSYHVVRIPTTLPAIDIVDEAGVTVTAAWDVLTDGTYNYYVLMMPVASDADVTYTLKE